MRDHKAHEALDAIALHWQWQSRWAVRQGDWKLIGRGEKAEELVSLAGDEPERQNLIKEHRELVERLTGLHNGWVREGDVRPVRRLALRRGACNQVFGLLLRFSISLDR